MTVASKNLYLVLRLILIFGLALIYLRYMERRTLGHPTPDIEYLPKEVGLDFKDVFFSSPDNIKLHAWFIPSQGAKYTVLFCHGNAGNISHRLEKLFFFNQLGCNVFIFDYRGYGKSSGRPSEKGLYLDAKSAYNYLLSQGINAEGIIGYGESLGATVVIDLASKNKMRAVIIDSAFSSAKDMVRRVYPLIPYWLFSSRLDSIGKIKLVGTPKLIIHSIDDEIVPYSLGRKLYEAAAVGLKEFVQIRGGHNSCFYDSEKTLKEKVANFLNKLSGQ